MSKNTSFNWFDHLDFRAIRQRLQRIWSKNNLLLETDNIDDLVSNMTSKIMAIAMGNINSSDSIYHFSISKAMEIYYANIWKNVPIMRHMDDVYQEAWRQVDIFPTPSTIHLDRLYFKTDYAHTRFMFDYFTLFNHIVWNILFLIKQDIDFLLAEENLEKICDDLIISTIKRIKSKLNEFDSNTAAALNELSSDLSRGTVKRELSEILPK